MDSGLPVQAGADSKSRAKPNEPQSKKANLKNLSEGSLDGSSAQPGPKYFNNNLMTKKNRLAEAIQKVIDKKNVGKSKREKKWKLMYEIKLIAADLGVSWRTVFTWYLNIYQPSGENERRLPARFRIPWEKFYYFE